MDREEREVGEVNLGATTSTSSFSSLSLLVPSLSEASTLALVPSKREDVGTCVFALPLDVTWTRTRPSQDSVSRFHSAYVELVIEGQRRRIRARGSASAVDGR